MAVNRRMWDESVALHVAARSYDVPGFLRGRLSIHRLEIEQVGPVRGRSLLHLQCHFGLDALSWARLGARVTGVDFSPPAIAAARQLASSTDIEARFVESNVYELRRKLRGKFDIVYTGKGALCWLPDLAAWAGTVAHFLKPGGRFYFLEDHPSSDVYENDWSTRELVLRIPYFGGRAFRDESEGTYAAPDAKLQNALSFSWIHPVSEVLGSLINAGLRIVSVCEYPYTYWRKFPFTRRGRDGWWHLTNGAGMIPLMWSVTAEQPLSSG